MNESGEEPKRSLADELADGMVKNLTKNSADADAFDEAAFRREREVEPLEMGETAEPEEAPEESKSASRIKPSPFRDCGKSLGTKSGDVRTIDGVRYLMRDHRPTEELRKRYDAYVEKFKSKLTFHQWLAERGKVSNRIGE